MDSNLSISDLLPIYPSYENNDYFNWEISRKKEFHVNVSKLDDKILNHQKNVSLYLSNNTTYNNILLFHKVGTGKTLSSITIIENNRKSGDYKGALILTSGQTLQNNYKQEMVKFGISNKDGFYRFDRFRSFIENDGKIPSKFNNFIICIDEIHNIREKDDKDDGTYQKYYTFLHSITNSKIILMSGTPMIDNAGEIVSIINFIIPEKERIERDHFMKLLKQEEYNKIKKIFMGRVSYVSLPLDVKVDYIKSGNQKITNFNLYNLTMTKKQTDYYKKSLGKDKDKSMLKWLGPIQASLFTYPTGEYGSEGYKENISTQKEIEGDLAKESREEANKTKNQKYFGEKYRPNSESVFFNELDEIIKNKSKEQALEYIKDCSIKYYTCIKNILTDKDKLHFVYMNSVEGSGLILFSLLLDKFGIQRDKKGGHILLTGNQVSEIKNDIERLNKDSNYNGSQIRVVLGSGIISEGVTFKNIQRIHILEPFWNFSGIDQAIARGIRYKSHEKLLDIIKGSVTVQVYLYCAVPDFTEKLEEEKDIYKYSNSVDEYIYHIASDKDKNIKKVERLLKESSFDCFLNKRDNLGVDFSRDCDYDKCEYYCGEKTQDTSLQNDTYNYFYSKGEEDVIIKWIHKQLKIYKYINIEDIFEEYSDKNNVLLYNSIYNTVDNMISDDIGNFWVVKSINNILYLTSYFGDYKDNFYTEYNPVKTETNIDSMIVNNDRYLGIINKINHEKDVECLIKILPEEFLTCLIEIVIENKAPLRENLSEYIKGKYSVQKKDEKRHIYKLNDKTYQYFNGKSVDVSFMEDDKEQAINKAKEKNINYIGILDKDDKFKIRRLDVRSKGKVCNDNDKELPAVLKELNIDENTKNKCEKIKNKFKELGLLIK